MQVVSKAEFARMCNVARSTVSGWIADQTIDGDALVGAGRTAQINVEVAQAQIRRRRDIGQALGNGLTTRLVSPPVPAASQPAPIAVPAPSLWSGPLPDPSPLGTGDLVEDRIKRERLAALERENRRKAEEEAERAGRYIEAVSARRQMGRVAKAVIEAFEGGLPQLANAMAERFEIPQRDVLHLLTVEVRKIRTRAAENARRQAEDMPRLVEDPEAVAEEG